MSEPSYAPSLWTYRYQTGEQVAPYGDDTTYRAALGWLYETCNTVEDWGAGAAYARKFVPPGKTYISIDGSIESLPHVDHVCELTEWPGTGFADGVFMRHVLEHNRDWQRLLRHAVGMFGKRFALVTFTPFSDGPSRPLRPPGDFRWDMSFNFAELTDHFAGLRWSFMSWDHRDRLQYGIEHLFMIERP